MSSWKDYVDLPQSASATPLKVRNPMIDNINQGESQSNDKKRAPTTPLTPTLVQRNILKKQVLDCHSSALTEDASRIEEFRAPTSAPRMNNDLSPGPKVFEDQLEHGNDIFEETNGSPRSNRASMGALKDLPAHIQNSTPRITAGIKQVVKDQKKSRVQMLKASSRTHDISFTDSEFSEASTISGETPNYKFQEKLVYFKNGYYVDGIEDSFAELERSAIINEKEMGRMNSLLDFMKLERQFGLLDDQTEEQD